MRTPVLLLTCFSLATPVLGAPLPFNDGMYASSPAICEAINTGADAWYEQFPTGIARLIEGPQITDVRETRCDVSNVRRDGQRVLFSAKCVTWDVWETVEGTYSYVSPDAFHFRGQTLSSLRCPVTTRTDAMASRPAPRKSSTCGRRPTLVVGVAVAMTRAPWAPVANVRSMTPFCRAGAGATAVLTTRDISGLGSVAIDRGAAPNAAAHLAQT